MIYSLTLDIIYPTKNSDALVGYVCDAETKDEDRNFLRLPQKHKMYGYCISFIPDVFVTQRFLTN